MPKFKVSVYRTGYSQRDIEIEAKDSNEASEVALDVAGDYEFSEQNSEYEVEYVEEIEPKPRKQHKPPLMIMTPHISN